MSAQKVLIVEDELIVQMHLESIVTELGHQLAGTAVDSREALAAAQACTPDLVLMDIRLSGGDDGVETARRLRERFHCSVVFVTAYADPDTLARTSEAMPAGYVVKPFTGAEVHAAITTALNGRRQHASSAARALENKDEGTETAVTTLPARPSLPSRSFGEGTRLLIYSHDTFGLGHLRRSLKLIRALTASHPGLSTLLVTGSPMVHQYRMPPGTDYIKLPAVRKVAPSAYEARSLSMPGEGISGLRANLLLRAVRDYEPDVLLADHSPLGMNGELLPSLRWLERKGSTRRVLGLRDIIDEPSRVIAEWNNNGVYDALRRHYDDVLIYGAPQVYDTIGEYDFPEDIAAKSHFLNYIGPSEPEADSEREGPPAALADDPRPTVVVSIGGGDGGAETVIGPFLDMPTRFRSRIPFRSEILTGPFVSADRERHFRDQAADLPVELMTFVPAPTRLYRHADLVLATAGYNTTTELLACARRAILIPRVMHRHEQLIRARRMAELGLVSCLHPEQVDSERLLHQILAALDDETEPLSTGRARGTVPLDGAQAFAHFCGELIVGGGV